MVAEWSKTLISQIQVEYCRLGTWFKSRLGYYWIITMDCDMTAEMYYGRLLIMEISKQLCNSMGKTRPQIQSLESQKKTSNGEVNIKKMNSKIWEKIRCG